MPSTLATGRFTFYNFFEEQWSQLKYHFLWVAFPTHLQVWIKCPYIHTFLYLFCYCPLITQHCNCLFIHLYLSVDYKFCECNNYTVMG